MTGGWPAAVFLAVALCWLGWLTEPLGPIVLIAGFAWLWRRS